MHFRSATPLGMRKCGGDGHRDELPGCLSDQTETSGGFCLQPAVPTQINRYGEGLRPLAARDAKKALREGGTCATVNHR